MPGAAGAFRLNANVAVAPGVTEASAVVATRLVESQPTPYAPQLASSPTTPRLSCASGAPRVHVFVPVFWKVTVKGVVVSPGFADGYADCVTHFEWKPLSLTSTTNTP
ncbi:MAG: hypothetical protein AUH85_17575 [Chloroflexi bacterium 13_1_40CM_4_68_4]|nr:MAG: hypothetical protein AUH85_17575 [Chloroflexi bacterium 13_1_40CM_4_68_4]